MSPSSFFVCPGLAGLSATGERTGEGGAGGSLYCTKFPKWNALHLWRTSLYHFLYQSILISAFSPTPAVRNPVSPLRFISLSNLPNLCEICWSEHASEHHFIITVYTTGPLTLRGVITFALSAYCLFYRPAHEKHNTWICLFARCCRLLPLSRVGVSFYLWSIACDVLIRFSYLVCHAGSTGSFQMSFFFSPLHEKK